ncbi:cache domain-containing protein [Pseudomarimonas arenosa]|uniref:Cache domain-containing protein n=1 Tax=Pseudomarimonas arenosa TaxID=2774145 RepID=A0AAW3ZPT9_9GAMM|nr:cache domain-containing protein [Pseudomarimonas arenosa]MBD8527117.1 cache domain-containing protein [Pseudomarimonas arenosa]
MRLGLILLAASVPATGFAQSPSPAELLDRVEAHFASTPRQQALSDISDRDGPFVSGDLYVLCVDADGVVVANGGFNSVIGKRADHFKLGHVGEIAKQAMRDMQGQKHGEIEYPWLNPKTGGMESKRLFLRRIGSDICGAGVYQGSPAPR